VRYNLKDEEQGLTPPSRAATSDGRPRESGRIYGYVVALLLLPALVLSRQDNVLFTPVGWTDPWFYFGYARNLVEFKRYLFRDLYYGTRLAWLLPAGGIYSLFSPVTAARVLHLLVWAVATLSFFFALRWIAGVRGAFLTALLLGMHPWLWNSTGWDYPDGAAIAYALAAIAWFTRAALQPPRRMTLLMAGAAAGCAVHCNLCWAALGSLLPLTYIGLAYAWHKRSPVRSSLDVVLWSGLGGALLTVVLGAVNYWLDGSFWLFGLSLRWGRGLVSHAVWSAAVWDANGLRPWLWFGAAGLLVSAVLLPGRLSRGMRHSHMPALVASLQLCLTLAVLGYMQRTGAPGLGLSYYACYLIPFTFLVAGTSFWRGIDRLSTGNYLPICAVAVGIFGFPWYAYTLPPLSAWLPAGLAAGLIVAILLSALFVRHTAAAALLAIAGFGLLTAETRPPAGASPHEARRNYERIVQTRERLELVRRGRRIDFWYDEKDPELPNYSSLVSTYIYNQSFFSTGFPQFACGSSTAPDTGVVVLSTRKGAAELARRLLADCWRKDGLLARVEHAGVVEGITQPYTVAAIFATPNPAVRHPLRAVFDGAGGGVLATLDHLPDAAAFPLDRWRMEPRTSAHSSPAGLQVRTPRAAFAFALTYPPLTAPATARYSFTIDYQPGAGWFAFGLCQPGRYNWMGVGTSQNRFQPPRQVVVFADLKQGETFELAIENNNNDGPGAASFAIQEVHAVMLDPPEASGVRGPVDSMRQPLSNR